MKRYYFHVSDDYTEIRDNDGVVLPDDEHVADFCRDLILAVASEDGWHSEGFVVRTITVADADGNEILTVPFAGALPGPANGEPAVTSRRTVH
ncbi:DUF6894 family protein [Microbaculum sp. FT89]|uniref:DUF6894 family protein n=1 Tax=Microbaculum sp. FT89 TaxID=3447298 RepID=UPI003F531F2C